MKKLNIGFIPAFFIAIIFAFVGGNKYQWTNLYGFNWILLLLALIWLFLIFLPLFVNKEKK
jgi:uncharacterized MAPEG superfamily protein